jgi:HD-like signal output (HDOD) protein
MNQKAPPLERRAVRRSASAVAELAATLSRSRPFPAVAGAVRRLVKDPRTQLADVAHAVEQDAGLSTDLLRLANAPTSGIRYECTSVRQAVTLLGMRRVCSVVDSAAALSMLERENKLPQHALSVAGVMRMLAPIAAVSPDDAFTVGLLHDIGVLLLVRSGDRLYEGLLEEAETGELCVEEEVELIGFDHAMVGAAVLRAWNLPDYIANVVELHHDWEAAAKAEASTKLLVSILRAAEAIATWAPLLERPTIAELDPLYIEPAFERLGLGRSELLAMWDGLRLATSRAQTVRGASSTSSSTEWKPRGPTSGVHVAAPAPADEAVPWKLPVGIALGLAALGAAAYAVLQG